MQHKLELFICMDEVSTDVGDTDLMMLVASVPQIGLEVMEVQHTSNVFHNFEQLFQTVNQRNIKIQPSPMEMMDIISPL